MGKSAMSCFNIITCSRDSADYDDLELLEFRVSSDKCRRSFRKRSAENQVLSKSVISEPPVIVNEQDTPESSHFTSCLQEDSFPCENIPSPKKVDDMLHCSLSAADSKVDDTSHAPEETKPDSDVEVSAAIVIQAAIREHLARKETKRLNCVIKLQAAVRGHFVRRQAADTLRSVQAIAKMQTLVQAHVVRRSVENLANQRKLDELDETVSERMKSSKESSGTKHKMAHSSTENLLANGFTRKLLESTPKTKPIHIDCDPSRSDSAWKWLERWMIFASKDIGQQQELNLPCIYQDQSKNTKLDISELTNEIPVAVGSVSVDSESASVFPAHGEQLTNNCTSDLEFQAPTSVTDECLSPQITEHQLCHQPGNGTLNVTQKNNTKNETIKERSSLNSSEAIFQSASVSLSSDAMFDKPGFKKEELNCTESGVKCESLKAEGKNSVLETRKVCNPAFVAAQSKFKELCSTDSVKSVSTYQDVSVGSKSENSLLDNFTNDNISITEDSVSHVPGAPTATSDCGTELSVSSTLDSPDRSEAEGGEIVLEIVPVYFRDFDVNGGFDDASLNLNPETKNLSGQEILQPPKIEIIDGGATDLIAAADSVQTKQQPSLEQHQAEPILSGTQVHLENVMNQEARMFLSGGSPRRSHKSAIESHETSSSQISLNKKKSSNEHNMHERKLRSQSVGKRSLSNLSNDSGGRSSTEDLPKGLRSGERRNSFGAPKLDHADHEPSASSSNSLPSYMQTTESSRAKVHASNSPKSSPEVHDNGSYMRKRKLSSSPRMQQLSSQMQQNAKGSMPHSSHDFAA